MKVSVITVSYNSIDTIENTINSVKSQRYSNLEYLVVDGASTDGTIDLLNQYSDNIDKLIVEKDSGIYDAMNKGIDTADGEIIGILNSDDIYTDDKVVGEIVDTFRSAKCDACYADLDYVDVNDTAKIIRRWRAGEYKDGDFYNGWMPPHPTVFIKKEVYEKYGKFNLSLGTAADYEIMLRFIHIHNIKVEYIPRTIVKMRTGGASNATLLNRLKANKYDRKAWTVNGLEPKPFTMLFKPLRKLTQFFFN